MRVYYSFTLLLFFFSATLAQTKIEGTIIEEETGDPVAGVLIQIDETTFSALSDENGFFLISDNLPSGDQIISYSKDGYENYLDIVEIVNGAKVLLPPVTMELTKQERKKRRKDVKQTNKDIKKQNKEREAKLKDAAREKEKRQKEIAKEKRKIEKGKKDKPQVIYVYEDPEPKETIEIEKPIVEVDPYLELRQKYANILEVSTDDIGNVSLYSFIEEWEAAPYLYGGSTKDGIDCSAFTLTLFNQVYGYPLERTAQTQFEGCKTEPSWLKGKGDLMPEEMVKALEEGDLFFFKGVAPDQNLAGHVGVYLGNYRFAHSTSNKDQNGNNGVQISDIRDQYWFDKLGALGRRSGLKRGNN